MISYIVRFIALRIMSGPQIAPALGAEPSVWTVTSEGLDGNLWSFVMQLGDSKLSEVERTWGKERTSAFGCMPPRLYRAFRLRNQDDESELRAMRKRNREKKQDYD